MPDESRRPHPFAARISALPPEKRALLLQKLPPLSFSQQRLRELEARPGAAPNVTALPVRLGGPLDPDALARSLGEVARRHEVLRTIFPVIEGRAAAVVLPPAPVALPVRDLSTLEPAERAAQVERLAGRAAQERFDLERGPLWRATLLRLGPEEHVVLLGAHHMIFDGWSAGVLLREVGHFYAAFRRGSEPRLPEPPAQYGDYARWQRESAGKGAWARAVDYWRGVLHDAPPLPGLPADFPRPAAWRTAPAASLPLTLDEGASQAVRSLCASEGVTLFMAGLAAFAAFLHANTGARDFVIGVPVAGRTLAATEGLIGSFVNLVLLRLRLSEEVRGTDLLARAREATLAAYEHQELPFGALLEELFPGEEYDGYGVRGRAPLFRVAFDFKNAAGAAEELPDLQVSMVETEEKMTGCDLYIKLWEEPQAVAGSVLYNRELFSAQTAARMVDEYGQTLARLASRPDLRLPELTASCRRKQEC
ncbi:MAG TPA: condensation domain-containing protein [Pyrinomonadaceae bacterium]|nr:condensation domain-containing protein [Pyrinomonadaceae bacterium]